MTDFTRLNSLADPGTLYAVGGIAAAWSFCEEAMRLLLETAMHPQWKISNKVFALMENQARADLLAHIARDALPDVAKKVDEFLTHYSICRENRNLVMHSMFLWDERSQETYLRKYARHSMDKVRTYDIPENLLFEIVEDCKRTSDFGSKLAIYLMMFRSELRGKPGQDEDLNASDLHTLPETPQKPNKLTPLGG